MCAGNQTRDKQASQTKQTVYLVEEHDDMSQFDSVKNTDVVQRTYSQDRYSQLLPQHATSSAAQAAQEPRHESQEPRVAPQLTVAYVAQ